MKPPYTTLYRPVNQAEFDLIAESGMNRFPPRLPQQPIFYPVMNADYAVQISTQWNVPAYGKSYVLEFDVDKDFLGRYEVQNVGGVLHDELWVPAEELEIFNDHIIGEIRTHATHE